MCNYGFHAITIRISISLQNFYSIFFFLTTVETVVLNKVLILDFCVLANEGSLYNI